MVHQAGVNGGGTWRQERITNTERQPMRCGAAEAKGVGRPQGNGIHAGCVRDESGPGAEPLGQRQERLSVDVIAFQELPCPCAAAIPPPEPPPQCLAAGRERRGTKRRFAALRILLQGRALGQRHDVASVHPPVLDTVHHFMHEKKAEPARDSIFERCLDIGVPHLRGIERPAVVHDHHDKLFVFQTHDELDPMRVVVIIPIADSVGQDLVDRQVDRVGDLRPQVPGRTVLVDPRGYAADWTVGQLREPAQKIADRIEALMNVDGTSEASTMLAR